MSPAVILAVAVAGAAGAVSRYALDRAVNARVAGIVPWGTFIVNVTGAFALGAVVGFTMSRDVSPIVTMAIGTGFLGAYTTFSTWMYETAKLIEERAWSSITINVIAPLLAGPAAAGLGLWLMKQF